MGPSGEKVGAEPLLRPSDNTQTRQKLQASRTFPDGWTRQQGTGVGGPGDVANDASHQGCLGASLQDSRTSMSRERQACPRSWSGGLPSMGKAMALHHSPPPSELLDLGAQRPESLPACRSGVPRVATCCVEGPAAVGDTETHKPRRLPKDEGAQLVNGQRVQSSGGCSDALAGVGHTYLVLSSVNRRAVLFTHTVPLEHP